MQLPSNNPALKSWVEIDAHSDFPIQNLPFGIFSMADRPGYSRQLFASCSPVVR